jgi:hypothetical protein
LPLQILQVGPQAGANAASVTLTVTGSQFQGGAVVSLVQGVAVRQASSVSFQDGQTLIATFNLNGLTPGLYDVQVNQGLQVTSLSSAFRVITGKPGRVETQFTVPPVKVPGLPGIVTVDYENSGDTDVAAPIFSLTVQSRSGRPIPMTLPGDDGPGSAPLQFLGINPDGQAGVLPHHFHRSLTITFHVPADICGHDTIHFGLKASFGNGSTIDWDAYMATLRPATIPADAWDAVFANLVAALGTTSASY